MEDRYVLLSIQYMIIDWFTMEPPEAVGETRSNMTYPVGVPLVALYMQPVRVYKYLVGFVLKSPSWASSRRQSPGCSMR